ncbi:MAG: flagellar biosynthesis protein FlhB [Cellvibrionaceae bacterium]|nr:flagellar biosynthesis protein FlhB [Cellvibrionaceae bacterium]
MADDNQSQEKTEEPTSKRLEKAREEGQIPRSKELTTTAVLLFSSLGFLWFGDLITRKFFAIMELNFSLSRELIFDPQLMLKLLALSLGDILLGLAPFFVLLFIASIVGPTALGGWLFSVKSLQPKFSRMNPIEGIKRMFSVKSLMELAKAVAKVLLMLLLTWLLLHALRQDLMNLANEDITRAIVHSATIGAWVAVSLSAATIVIAVIDVPFQIWDHAKKLKMSLQDIKDEMKDTDGKPEVKSRIRQLQQAMANRRMMGEVPDADVIITNPSHYAVAVKYKPDKMKTPIVVAKGVDQIALKIREVAAVHAVEIVQSPLLARAVYHTTAIDEEIPGELYIAIAKVLAYVFQLRRFREGTAQRPGFPHHIDIPESMIYEA